MRTANASLLATLTLVLGCTNNTPPPPPKQTPLVISETSAGKPSNATLVDGVYPVVSEVDSESVPLPVVPVSAGEGPTSLRIKPTPILKFRELAGFDFKFENNECTEIGFRNTPQLKEYTRDNVGRKLAVVIDRRVISHHKIREAITSEKVRITCCTVGGGDHLHKHLQQLKLAGQQK